MVCDLIGGATLAIRQRIEIPFVHGPVKTPNASPQTIELNPRSSEQAIPGGLELALEMKTWSTDVRLENSAPHL